MKIFDIAEKKILITGGSSGIGRSLACFLHGCGAHIVISGTKEEKLQEVVSQLGERASYVVFDLYNYKEAGNIVIHADKAMGGLDALVCNAGATHDALSMRMGVDAWDSVININLSANFFLNKAAAKIMLKNKYGKIINLSSIVAFTGNPGQANYSAAKGAIVSMSKSMALEYASKNISINCIAPGFIGTPMTDKLSEEQSKYIVDKIPMHRMGECKDLHGAALFLLSSASDYVTGQVLHVNGGMYM